MDSINTKNIGNTIYHAAVLSVLTVGISMGSKYLLGKGIGDLSKPGIAEVGKLVVATTIAVTVKSYIETKGFPETVLRR